MRNSISFPTFRSASRNCLVAALAASILAVVPAQAPAQQAAAGATIAEFLGRGEAAFQRGDFLAASEAWRQAARFCRTEGRFDQESDALARSAEANLALGFVVNAIVELKAAQRSAEQAGDDRVTAAVLGALGNAQLIGRSDAEAKTNIERSIELARKTGDRATLAASLNNLGNLLAATGSQPEALQRYSESAREASGIGDRDLQVVALRNAGRMQLRQRDQVGGFATLREAADAARGGQPSHAKVLGLVSIGTLLITPEQDRRSASLAYETLKSALTLSESIGDLRGQSMAYGFLGRLYEVSGRAGEAMILTDRAIDLAQREKMPELLYRWDWQQARLLKASGNDAAALDAYLRAVRELQDIRRDIPIDYEEGRSSFRETIGPLFLQLADLLMRKASTGKDIGEINQYLAQARDTVEKIKTAELQDYFKDQCIDSVGRKSVKIEAVAPQTAVVYPIILPDRLELLVSLADGDTFATSQVTEKDLTEAIRELRTALQDLNSPTGIYIGHAKRVYDWVIRPLENILKSKNVQTLVVVPDGPLRTVPLAALHDGSKFLIETYAIATAPGLTLVDPAPLNRQARSALVVGVSEGVQGFPPIPDAQIEVDTISERLGATKLLNQAFVVSAFEQQLQSQPFKIVHIASHAVFGGSSEDSFVLAYDAKITMNKIEELFKFNRAQPEPVELLTLSACETAAGNDRAPLGLAGVALKSGARSSIASLWSVVDIAAAEMSADMYAQLFESDVSKAEALRRAQLKLLRSERYAHPAFWAPFLLIGNWL